MRKRHLLIFQEDSSVPDYCRDLENYQWQPHVAQNIDGAIEILASNKCYVGLCSLDRCDDEQFIDQLIKLLNHAEHINWVIVSPKDMQADACYTKVKQLIASYCYDYLTLPVSIERLLFTLGHSYGMAEISTNPYKKVTEIPNYKGIIGNSPIMIKLFKQIEKVCKEDCSVLIEGETGTGKELVAEAIHKNSNRAKNPLVTINCGAFPKDLIQAELFGYEKGAFTGAHQQKIGRIESAQGGTLFLDEIGDLPLPQQVNLLRFLEEKKIERVGGINKIPVDVRIISATHINLKKAVESGTFREDLYFRLRELYLKTPPLREREDDIELLTWFFFNKFRKNSNQKPKGFNLEALNLLQLHDWPGNIRELKNCIRHALVMSENRLLTPADLGIDRRSKERVHTTLEQARANTDRETILAGIRHTGYNISRAAEYLGISRVTLYRLIEKYQLTI